MGYTAVKGGEEAIRAAEALESAAGGCALTVEAVEKGMRYAVDAVMSEAGLYAPALAARAVVEAQGDLAEAAFLLRAYRSTLPRVGYTSPASTGGMRLVRRVSSAFKDVPGGQVLGATRDYSQRLLGLKKEGAVRWSGVEKTLLPKIGRRSMGQRKSKGRGTCPGSPRSCATRAWSRSGSRGSPGSRSTSRGRRCASRRPAPGGCRAWPGGRLGR